MTWKLAVVWRGMRCGTGANRPPHAVVVLVESLFVRVLPSLGRPRVGLLFVWRRMQINIKGLKDREIQRVVDEIKLLKTLKHPSLIKFYTAFTKGSDRIIFITELMTSGTLQEYVAPARVAHGR